MSDPFHTKYRALSDVDASLVTRIKEAATGLYVLIGCVEAPREQALAKTKLEEAVMWAVKGVTK